jgi:hypothetical protein
LLPFGHASVQFQQQGELFLKKTNLKIFLKKWIMGGLKDYG